MIPIHTVWLCAAVHTRVSPSGARGSVIQEPNLDPDVLMVMGSLMPVSLPHAERKEARREHLEQHPFGYFRLIQNLLQGIYFHLLQIQKPLPEGWGSRCPACCYVSAFLFARCAVRGAYYSHMFTHANACFTLCVDERERESLCVFCSCVLLVSCHSVN